MTVTKAVYGRWATLTGTMAEVAAALQAERVMAHQCKGVVYDGTLNVYAAIYCR